MTASTRGAEGTGEGAAAADALFAGPGEMRARSRAHDWAATPLSSVESWPAALRVAVRLMLASPVATSLWCGPEYTLLYNDAYAPILGAKHPRALGRSGAAVWDELWPTLAPQFEGIRGGGPPVFADDALLRMERLEGGHAEDAWFTYALSALTDEAGACLAVYNVAVEISERVRAEAERDALLASERAARAEAEAARAQSEAVLGSIADPFILLDRQWRITQVNDAAEPPLRTGRSRLLGRTLWDAFPGLEGSLFEPYYRDAMATGRPAAVEDYFAPLDTWFDVHIYPWPGGLMVHFHDVSARKSAEGEGERLLADLRGVTAAAQAGERRARFLADLGHALQPVTEPDAVMETAARLLGEHLGADRCAYAEVEADEDTFTITGNYTRGDTLGILGRFTFRAFGAEVLRLMRANEAYVVDDAAADPRVTPADRAAYEQTQIAAVICVPLHKAGRFAAAMAVHQRAPRRWTPDEVDLVVTVVQRCWESLERARALRRLRESEAALRATSSELAERTVAAEAAQHAAEAADRAKAEFLATMSHELRTPLNAIGGYAELLELGLRGPVTELQRTDLARIQQSQRHLLGLVNEVLDLAKVDSGELKVERATVRAGDTVDAALALVRPQAAAKALVLAEACGGAADRPYLGDEPRVRQVLVNLLANAVKFTAPGGHVSVTCALTDAPPAEAALAPDAPYVALRVEDTGVGIAPDQLARIFEPFTQAEGGLTRPRGGTGLGLAISRRLARLMGGDLTVESRPGTGSAFTLWLPTPERRVHPRPPAATSGPERRTPPANTAIEAPGVARIGEALVSEVGPVLRAWVERLRADPEIPDAAARSDAELEDHAATFVTDVALALRTMGQLSGEPAALLRDGTAILALIAERHGAQRARLGWPEAAIAREHALLAEVLDSAVRRLAAGVGADAAAAARAIDVVTSLLGQATRLSVSGYRLVTGAAGA